MLHSPQWNETIIQRTVRSDPKLIMKEKIAKLLDYWIHCILYYLTRPRIDQKLPGMGNHGPTWTHCTWHTQHEMESYRFSATVSTLPAFPNLVHTSKRHWRISYGSINIYLRIMTCETAKTIDCRSVRRPAASLIYRPDRIECSVTNLRQLVQNDTKLSRNDLQRWETSFHPIKGHKRS